MNGRSQGLAGSGSGTLWATGSRSLLRATLPPGPGGLVPARLPIIIQPSPVPGSACHHPIFRFLCLTLSHSISVHPATALRKGYIHLGTKSYKGIRIVSAAQGQKYRDPVCHFPPSAPGEEGDFGRAGAGAGLTSRSASGCKYPNGAKKTVLQAELVQAVEKKNPKKV